MEDFLKDLPDKQSKKIAWTLRVVRDLEQVPTQYLKKLKSTDDIWEVRATIGNNTFQLLGFFDGSKLIVLTSGFAKKTNKVPKQDTKYREALLKPPKSGNEIITGGKVNEKGRFRNFYR